MTVTATSPIVVAVVVAAAALVVRRTYAELPARWLLLLSARTPNGRFEPRLDESEGDSGEREVKRENRAGVRRALLRLRGSGPRRAHRGTLSVTVISNDPLSEFH